MSVIISDRFGSGPKHQPSDGAASDAGASHEVVRLDENRPRVVVHSLRPPVQTMGRYLKLREEGFGAFMSSLRGLVAADFVQELGPDEKGLATYIGQLKPDEYRAYVMLLREKAESAFAESYAKDWAVEHPDKPRSKDDLLTEGAREFVREFDALGRYNHKEFPSSFLADSANVVLYEFYPGRDAMLPRVRANASGAGITEGNLIEIIGGRNIFKRGSLVASHENEPSLPASEGGQVIALRPVAKGASDPDRLDA